MTGRPLNYLTFTMGHQVRLDLSYIVFYMEGDAPHRFIPSKLFEFIAHFGVNFCASIHLYFSIS